jgi:AcrR family transcriptional regulator
MTLRLAHGYAEIVPSHSATRTLRRDAADNRERLLAAARTVFNARGYDAPLDEVAQAADVSRATLYRNFATREELVAAVSEDNVALIEAQAAVLRDRPDGIVGLVDFVLDLQDKNRSLTHVLIRSDADCVRTLTTRTATAFAPLVARGKQAGLVRPDVEVEDVMIAFAMADGAMAHNEVTTLQRTPERIRAMIHRTIFTTS